MKKFSLLAVVLTISMAISMPMPEAAQSQAVTSFQPASAKQTKAVTTPKELFGFNIGDDYCLANYQQLKATGRSSSTSRTGSSSSTSAPPRKAGRNSWPSSPSPANHRKLRPVPATSPAAWHLPTGSDQPKPRKLAAEGKAVVWIDAGLHASEVALPAGADRDRSTSSSPPTTPRRSAILDDVIILFVHANPDGMDLVADWYMQRERPEEAVARRPAAALPEVRRPRQQPRLLRQHPGRDART